MATIDLIIPVYRSKAVLPSLIRRIEGWIHTSGRCVRVIFVEDGGGDDTYDRLKDILQTSTLDYVCIRLAKNYGQYSATAAGLFHSDADWVATMDDDLQHGPEDLERMIATLVEEEADLVYGVYEVKKHSLIRNLGSWFLKRLMRKENQGYTDVTSFRLMQARVVQELKREMTPVVFLDEFLLRHSAKQRHCVVSHAKRQDGASGYSHRKLLKITFSILLFHSSYPLKLIIRFGMAMSFVFFVLGCYYIYQKLANDIQLGFTSIIVAIFFSTGMILLSLGIIGEYIRKIWTAQHQSEKILIQETCTTKQ